MAASPEAAIVPSSSGYLAAGTGYLFFPPDRVFQALTKLSGDLSGDNIVKMACEVPSACCWPTSQTSKHTLALEAK